MEKEKILQLITEKLQDDLEALSQAAKSAHDAATHSENIADNKYDTLSLEASYIAQGQANRAQELKRTLLAYQQLKIVHFDENTPIILSAMITLEDEEGAEVHLFLGALAGGLKINQNGTEIMLITGHSPLGKALLGKTQGELVEVRIGNEKKEYEIVKVA